MGRHALSVVDNAKRHVSASASSDTVAERAPECRRALVRLSWAIR